MRVVARLAGIAAAAALAACAGLPPPQPRAESHAYATAEIEATPLAALVRSVVPTDGRSAFRLMPDGPNALATRLELARAATRSLDVQYYILSADNTGRSLLRELRAAAARGVRVRLLIDDLYTAGEDELLLGLATAPGVEVRLFNPFAADRSSLPGRFVASAADFARLDRRMHNKLFVADNSAAVTGGRNMADAYVTNADGSNFLDMDVFAAGPVVRELSASFDAYWNSQHVYPIGEVASSARLPAERLAAFDRAVASAEPPEVHRLAAGGGRVTIGDTELIVSDAVVRMIGLPFEIADRRLGAMIVADAHVLYDPPAKLAERSDPGTLIAGTVTAATVGWLRSARTRIKIVSPYFVPSPLGLRALHEARAAGIEIDVVTNSLASTDEPLAYAGYRRHLRELLAMGINVYEISPTLSVQRHRLGLYGKRTGALHMKSATRDGSEVYLGSMNFDLRSAHLNTELGIIIDSPEMAADLQSMSDPGSSYLVRLGPGGRQIEWVARDDLGHETVHTEEPETSAWLRFRLRLLSAFVSDNEL